MIMGWFQFTVQMKQFVHVWLCFFLLAIGSWPCKTKEKYFICLNYTFIDLPSSATFSIGTLSSWAMKPMTEKITKPAKILVALFVHVTIIVSLLLGGKRFYVTQCNFKIHLSVYADMITKGYTNIKWWKTDVAQNKTYSKHHC